MATRQDSLHCLDPVFNLTFVLFRPSFDEFCLVSNKFPICNCSNILRTTENLEIGIWVETEQNCLVLSVLLNLRRRCKHNWRQDSLHCLDPVFNLNFVLSTAQFDLTGGAANSSSQRCIRLFRPRTMDSNHNKLENVAINDVLPLEAARRDAIANLKCFWASETRDLISMVTFAFTMRRHLIRLA